MPFLQVAIYARVSSEHQTDGGTIASQVAALEARLAQEGLRLQPDHRFVDDGFSGSTLRRPALEQLRDAIAAGAVDRVYVHSPDRLARHYAYQVLLVDEFRRAGVEVVFLNRPLGQSPEDDLLLQVQGMIAEYERAKILERSRRGKRHAAHAGNVSVFSAAPYGYRYIGQHTAGGIARYEVVEEQAAVVRQIFQWVGVDRLGIREICLRLGRSGQPSPTGRPRWASSTVGGILKNPAYKGAAAFGKTRPGPAPARLRPRRGEAEQPKRDGGTYDAPVQDWITVPVPALIEPALFEAVQAQLAENRLRHRRAPASKHYLLGGLVVCKLCGYAYYGKTVCPRARTGERREYPYYRCCGSDASRFGGQRVCTNAQVRADHLNAIVWKEVERLLNDPQRLAAEYQRRLRQIRDGDAGQADLSVLDAQVSKLKRGIGRLIDSYAEGIISKEEFGPRLAGLRQRLASLEERRRSLLDQTSLETTLTLLVGRLEDFAGHVRSKLAAFDWQQRRDLIRLLVKRVEIDRDTVTVVFRVAPLSDDRRPGGGRTLQDCPRRQHVARGPVHHRDQVQEAAAHGNVRNIGAPHLVGAVDGQVAQQVRPDLMLGVGHRRLRTLVDGLQAHPRHQAANPLAVDLVPLPAEMTSHLPAAVPRRFQELRVDQPHQFQVLGTLAIPRLVVAGAAERHQRALLRDRQARMLRLDQLPPPADAHRPEALRKKSRSTTSCPIMACSFSTSP